MNFLQFKQVSLEKFCLHCIAINLKNYKKESIDKLSNELKTKICETFLELQHAYQLNTNHALTKLSNIEKWVVPPFAYDDNNEHLGDEEKDQHNELVLLRNCQNLKRLYIDGLICHNSKSIKDLFKLGEYLPNLEVLSYSSKQSEKGRNFLQVFPKLKKLTIKCSQLKSLVNTLANDNTELKSLSIEGGHPAKFIEKISLTNTSITSLTLKDSAFSANDVNSLKNFKSLRSIKLQKEFSSRGKESLLIPLASLIETHKNLRFLKIKDQLSLEDCTTLVQSAAKSSSLTALDLSWNTNLSKINGLPLIQALEETLKTNETLQELNLDGIYLGSEAGCLLGNILKTNKTIKKIDISEAEIGLEAALIISDALKTNTTLKYLDLTSNKLGKQGCIKMIEALQENQTITTLGLAGNGLEEEEVFTLIEICKRRDIDFRIDFNVYLDEEYANAERDRLRSGCIIS